MATRLLLASNNSHKLDEFRGVLGPQGVTVLAPADLGIVLDVAETGASFSENARLKAEAFCRVARMMTVADDSGLVVDVLRGEPGIFSARYAGPEATDADRIGVLLANLRGVADADRTARFVAALALARPGHDTVVFESEVAGVVTQEPHGNRGFGYDPIFFYPPLGRTFGEIDREAKAAVSHRGRALAALARFLRTAEDDCILS